MHDPADLHLQPLFSTGVILDHTLHAQLLFSLGAVKGLSCNKVSHWNSGTCPHVDKSDVAYPLQGLSVRKR